MFGSRLARRLAQRSDVDVVVAGRSLEKATAHCRAFGGTPLAIDRDGDIGALLAAMRPRIVIDAAGPFQAYGRDRYRLARAAISAGAHYLDLADDAAFVAGIVALDELAKAAGVMAISGASSVPAISAAALDELTFGLDPVALVGSAILPGNRAPRGLSVVRAIVGQAGRPLRQWRGGRWIEQPAWGDLKHFALKVDGVAPLQPRIASAIGAPDLLLFPGRYGARSARFHAGLDLTLLHRGLWLLAWPVRLGLMRSLGPFAAWFKWVADRLECFGSDRGGMMVRAIGRDSDGRAVERRWTLIAEAGDGPEVPPTPALLIAEKLLAGHYASAGASPAVGLLSLREIEAGLAPFRIGSGRSEHWVPTLMERLLPDDFAGLPEPWRRLGEIHDIEVFEGAASVERGSGLLARIVAALFGFPPAANEVAVTVTKEKTPNGERWTRSFAGKRFVSHLSRKAGDPAGVFRERFGPFSFSIRLQAKDGRVSWPVEGWRALGVAMPRRLMPRSETFEFVDAGGRFRFDVGIALPLAGAVVRYRGSLAPSSEQADSSIASPAAAPSSIQA